MYLCPHNSKKRIVMHTKKTILLAASLFTAVAASASAPQLPLTLWYNQPATYFEESLPVGNGRLGALVYGQPADDAIILNDLTLWSGTPVDPNEDAGAYQWIPLIRQALFAEDYALADSLQLHVQGHNSSYYQPMATLHIKDADGTFSNYRRSLNLDSALVRVSYDRGGVSYQREYIASAPDQLVAIRLSASKARAINVQLSFSSLLQHTVTANASRLTLTGHAEGSADESTHFCTIANVTHRDGSVAATDTSLVLNGVSEATIYIVNETSFNGFNRHPVLEGAPYEEQAARQATRTALLSFDDVFARHVADYRQYFDRLRLNLSRQKPTAGMTAQQLPTDSLLRGYGTTSERDRYLETLYFQYGRYLLISCSRTPAVPANLQGLWNPHVKAPWRSNYTININLEENYWPVFVANLAEMAMPLDGFVAALAQNGQHTARNYWGVNRGWCAGHNSDIWAMANPVGEKNEKPEWANWPLGGAWLVLTLWERYQFTQDEDYLRQTAYPLMKGAAEFCLDWLIENPSNPQELITAPSTSPENEYITDKGYHGMTCYGGTADLAIIRELFTNTIAAHHILEKHSADKKIDPSLVDECLPLQIALNRLHPYTIGSEGDLNEWYYDWRDYDPHHRHQSHLIGLYPGHHIAFPTSAADDTQNALLQACEHTLIQKGEKTTGWSTGWRINLWARLHKGDMAYHIYRKLLEYVPAGPRRKGQGGGTYPNLFDAHPPFQIDGNFGGTAGVCEMLVQSSENYMELLPALPAEWADGEVSGLRTRGGYEVAMRWHNGQVETVSVTSCRTTPGTVTVCYNGKTTKLNLKAGETVSLNN